MGVKVEASSHRWSTFYNPRNGRVRIQACAKCGIAKPLAAGRHVCVAVPPENNRMHNLGWKVLPSYA